MNSVKMSSRLFHTAFRQQYLCLYIISQSLLKISKINLADKQTFFVIRFFLCRNRYQQAMLISTIYILNLQMREGNKKGLESRVSKYKEEKIRHQNLKEFMSEKRRNIQRLIQEHKIEPEPQLDLEKFSNTIDIKRQRYLHDMNTLGDTRIAIIQAKGTLEGLELEISLQQQSLQALRKTYAKQVESQQEVLARLKGRLDVEKVERGKMEEERCQRQLDHVQKLTNQKEQLIERTEEMISKRKNLDLTLKKLKDNFEKDYKARRQEWMSEQNQRRQRWQIRKQQEINQSTLKSIQPEISRIVGAGKQQISRLQQMYESLRNEFTKEMNKQFEDNLRLMRFEIKQRVEADMAQSVQRIIQQQRKLMESLISDLETEKGRLRIGKEAELRQLQNLRKKEAEQFMLRNKDYLLSHLEEVKKVKENYETEIRQIDGSLDKILWKEQVTIKQHWLKKLSTHRQQKIKEFQGRLQAYKHQQQQQSEEIYKDIVQKTAVENALVDSELRRQTDAKLRQYRKNHEAEMKSLRKQLQVLMVKQRKEQQALHNISQKRLDIQQQHELLLRENQYLLKKEIQYQAEVLRLKVKEDELQLSQEKDLQRLKQQWQEQFGLLEKKIVQAESEAQAQESIMNQKQEEKKVRIIGIMNKLESESLILIQKLRQDIEIANYEKVSQEKTNRKLTELRNKFKKVQIKTQSSKKIPET